MKGAGHERNYTLYDCTHVKCPEWAKSQEQKVNERLLGAWGGGREREVAAHGSRVSLGSDENVLKLLCW